MFAPEELSVAKKKTNSDNQNNALLMNSEAIQRQTEDFLKGGGKINVVRSGVSGFNFQKGSKQIILNSKKEKA